MIKKTVVHKQPAMYLKVRWHV